MLMLKVEPPCCDKNTLVWLWQRCSFLVLLLSVPLNVGAPKFVFGPLIIFIYTLASNTIYFISSLFSMLSKQPS